VRLLFAPVWSWSVPLVGCAAVFVFVLLTTPPGFAAIGEVVFVSARGPLADAASYALGAAASLALVTLLALAAICAVLALLIRRLRA
jgi:hypothetical protein